MISIVVPIIITAALPLFSIPRHHHSPPFPPPIPLMYAAAAAAPSRRPRRFPRFRRRVRIASDRHQIAAAAAAIIPADPSRAVGPWLILATATASVNYTASSMHTRGTRRCLGAAARHGLPGRCQRRGVLAYPARCCGALRRRAAADASDPARP